MLTVSKYFGATRALDSVSFDVRSGEVCALVGENGAGKSTLMKVLAGTEKPNSGQMKLDGAAFCPSNPLEARENGVAMIYQELSLVDHLTVEQNVFLGMEPSRVGIVDRKESLYRTRKALSELGHHSINPDTVVRNLSIAKRQVVEIARALATGCRVLILDEPTSSLARHDVEQLFRLVAKLKKQGHAIVYISHFIEEVKEVSDRFTVLRDGQMVGSGKTASSTIDEIVAMMVGRKINQLYPRSMRVSGEAVVTVTDLSGEKKPISAGFTLRSGEVLGIAGLVGSGRTELLRALFSLDKVKSGKIRVGTFSGPSSPTMRLAQGMGLVSEDRKAEGLAISLSVADNLTLSNMHCLGLAGFVFPSRMDAASSKWIERLNIRCREPRQSVASLSGGNQQKVALARLLHHNVNILLLDEPTRGVDVASKAQIYRLIHELATGNPAKGIKPRSVLMISSYLPELLGVCDRIAVMSRGVLGEAKDSKEWSEHALLLAATSGGSDD